MEVKLSRHRLASRYEKSGIDNIVIGTKVCSGSSAKSVGVVVDKGETMKRWGQEENRTATVLWVTGSKKGKRQVIEAHYLANFDAFRNEIAQYLEKLDELKAEAESFGK